MAITDIELISRLAGADRAPLLQPDPETLAELAGTSRVAARRRRIRRRIIGAGLTAVLVAGAGVSAPAVADGIRHFLAESSPDAIGMTQLNATPIPGRTDCGEAVCGSEWVDVGASDIDAYIVSVWQTQSWLPLAPGQTPELLIAAAEQHAANMSDGLAQEALFQADFERQVFNGWLGEYLKALQANDPGRAAVALDTMIDALDWPAYAQGDGAGVTTLMRLLLESVQAGNVDDAQALAQMWQIPEWDGIDRSARLSYVNCQAMQAAHVAGKCWYTSQTGNPDDFPPPDYDGTNQ